MVRGKYERKMVYCLFDNDLALMHLPLSLHTAPIAYSVHRYNKINISFTMLGDLYVCTNMYAHVTFQRATANFYAYMCLCSFFVFNSMHVSFCAGSFCNVIKHFEKQNLWF